MRCFSFWETIDYFTLGIIAVLLVAAYGAWWVIDGNSAYANTRLTIETQKILSVGSTSVSLQSGGLNTSGFVVKSRR